MTLTRPKLLPTSRRAASRRRVAFVVAGLCAAGLSTACAQDSSLNVGRLETGRIPATASPGSLGTPIDLAVLDRVEITEGDKGPSLKLATTPLQVSATTRRVVKASDGPAAKPGYLVLMKALVVRGSDGSQLETTFADPPQSLQLTAGGTLKGLVTGLTGAQKGSRVLIAVPPAESFEGKGNAQATISPAEHLLFLFDIVDVFANEAQGSPVPAVPGVPTVTAFDTTKGPTVAIPAGAAPPTALVSQTLLEGTGAPVQAGQEVVVHYTGVLWKDGSVFDSSWARQQAFNVTNVGNAKVISAWNKGFIGKKVGSRVVLVVPPSEGYGQAGSPPKISGTDTLVFVVDILAAI